MVRTSRSEQRVRQVRCWLRNPEDLLQMRHEGLDPRGGPDLLTLTRGRGVSLTKRIDGHHFKEP